MCRDEQRQIEVLAAGIAAAGMQETDPKMFGLKLHQRGFIL